MTKESKHTFLAVAAASLAVAMAACEQTTPEEAGATAPDDEFRIVTEPGACGDVDNEIIVDAWAYYSSVMVRKAVDPPAEDERWAGLVLDGPKEEMEEMTAAIRTMRRNGEHVALLLNDYMPFDVVMEFLGAVRAAGVRCVFMADSWDYYYCDESPTRLCSRIPPRPSLWSAEEGTAPEDIRLWRRTIERLLHGYYPLPLCHESSIRLHRGRANNWEERVSFFSSRQIAIGDLDGDQAAEAAVIAAYNGGGSGTFVYLLAMHYRDGAPVQAGVWALGDRTNVEQLAIRDGRIFVTMSFHLSSESVHRKYTLDDVQPLPSWELASCRAWR